MDVFAEPSQLLLGGASVRDRAAAVERRRGLLQQLDRLVPLAEHREGAARHRAGEPSFHRRADGVGELDGLQRAGTGGGRIPSRQRHERGRSLGHRRRKL